MQPPTLKGVSSGRRCFTRIDGREATKAATAAVSVKANGAVKGRYERSGIYAPCAYIP